MDGNFELQPDSDKFAIESLEIPDESRPKSENRE